MRRLLALASALAVLAGPLAAGQAWAKDHGAPHGQGRGGGEGRWSGGRGGPPPGYGRGGEPPPGYGREGPPPGYGRGGEPPPGWRGEPRYEPRGEPRYYDPRDGYAERGYAPPPPPPRSYSAPRRGGYLGPQGGARIEDPGRYRLREAPRGYAWVRIPGGMAMVSEATGQIFDVVPDGR
jgi:Ni/Co efflux regulator RcnB